jgi:predicted nuclease with TOPRIM domain
MANLPTWLHMAAQVYAPQQVLLVGAGNGTGPVVQALLALQAMPRFASLQAHALEAHAPTLAQLAKRLGPDSTWQLSADVVIGPHGEANPTYHHYSLGTESSLLPPSELQTLWPSLQLMGEQPASSGVPINNLLHSLLPSPWLLLDCLPAAHLLHGADLSHAHVLLARVVLGAPDQSPSGSTLTELQAQLAPQGYQLAACFAERNTQLAKTLWLRDPAWLQQQAKDQADQALSELSKAHEAQAKSKEQELQALQTAINEAQQATEQLKTKLDAEAQVKAALQAQLQAQAHDLEVQKIQVAALKSELSKANEQAQAQIKSLQADLEQAQAHAEQVASEHAQQLEKERAQADQALSEQSKAHEAQAKGRAQELQALQTANEEAKQANEQLQAKLAAEVQAKQDLQAQNAQALAQAAELQNKLAAEIQAKQAGLNKSTAFQKQVSELNSKLSVLEGKHQNALLLQEALKKELLKAEVQIELIKNLMKEKAVNG